KSKLGGVDVQLLADLVDHRLHGECGLSRAGGPVGIGTGFVDADVESFHARMRQVVTGEDTHATWANGRTGKGSRLIRQVGVGGDQGSVTSSPNAKPDVGSRSWPRRFQDRRPI